MTRSRQKRRMAAQRPPMAAVLAYQSILRKAVRQRQAVLFDAALAAYTKRPRSLGASHGRLDAARHLGPIRVEVEQSDVQAIAQRVNKKNALEFKRVVGIPTRDLGVGHAVEMFRERNTDLITSLGDREVTALEGILDDAQRGAWRVEDLKDKIQDAFGMTQSKADLLARDQTLKLNGELTELRQTNAGITSYIWTTSEDERVRPAHADLDGTEQSWDDPPEVSDDGRREHPGGDYQCRCVAVPILPDDLGDD